MATWAKGIDFKNTNNSKRIGGVGVYGTDTTTNKLYIGLGTEPWNNAGLQLTNSAINFKGNKIYHAGDKPTASEIGAAASSHTHNYAGSSSAGGNANAAVKLATARTLTVGNTGKTFDGSANVAWSLSEIGAAAASHTHNYLPLSGGTLTGNVKFNMHGRNNTIFNIYDGDANGHNIRFGGGGATIVAAGDCGANLESVVGTTEALSLAADQGIDFYVNCNTFDNKLKATLNTSLHFYPSVSGQGYIGTSTYKWNGMYANTFYGALSGNASTATKLQTARIINGTSFDGSANITTAQWGTARTLTIGNSGKSVNGSANVSWSLSEIGALPTAGGTMTGNIVVGNNIGLSHSSNGLFLRHNNGATVLSAKDSTIYFRPKGDLDSSAQVTIDNAGNVTAPKFTGALSGNATTATKLQTARTVKLEGDVTGSFSFDGSANKTFTARRRVAICGQPGTADTTNVYFKVASWSTATNNQDARITFHVTSDYSRSDFGILEVLCRRGSELTKYDKKEITWLTASGINKDNFYLVYGNDGTNTIFEIWMKETSSHICYRFSVLDEGNRTNVNNPWTLYNSQTGKTPSGTASLPSGYTVVNSTFATSSNNATSAATLTTARTLTVGNTGKSFNGSANVSWSLAEIGALPLSGGTMTGNITLNNVKGIYGKTGADLVNADNETVASGTSGAILVYNSAHNLHIGSLIYDKNLVTGSTYVNGAVNLMHRTNDGYIGMQPSRTTTTSFYSTYTNSTVPIKSSVHTGTYLDGNKGKAIISSTNTAGGYTTLIKSNSTNGYFTLNSYQKNLLLAYTDKTTVDAGTNSATKQAILLDETGNTSFPGKVSASGGFSGNATTASKLQSVRTINGTNFDGSGNITTANWGTARTITIGNTGKSVNGSANVSWSLSEIGAAASSHTHNYAAANSAGGGALEVIPVQDTANKLYLTGILDFNSAKIRASTPYMAGGTITATTFAGALSGNASTATKLATGRTLKIGNTGKTFDGSANVTWTLSELGALPLTGGTLTGALKFGKAMISDSTQDNTLIINGIQSSSTGAIKLGSGGCRIYGIGDTAKLYVEGGIYTNGDVDAGGGNVKNVTNIWGERSEVIIEPKRGTGFTGGASFNWTGATTVGSPRYQLTPTDTTDFRVGSPERPIHGVHGKNSYVTTSDRRAKENIVYIEHETRLLSGEQRSNLKEVLTKEDFYNFFKDEIKFTSYDMIGGNIENLETNIGFIAQEIADTKVGSKIVIPPREKIEYHNEDGSVDVEKVENGMYAFSTGNFASATAIALQNSIEKIESLTELVNNLINEINILKNK